MDVTCPYNNEHKIQGTDLRMHIMTCKDSRCKDTGNSAVPQATKKKTNLKAFPVHFKHEQPEMKVYGPKDPERLLQCPYDANHQIRACRYPYHLIKYRKTHQDVAMQLATCPFNACHMVPRAELSHHISSCEDKSCIEQDNADENSIYKRDVKPSMWTSPPCSEDWDQDLQSKPPSVFMWGTPSYPVPSSGTLMDPKSSLGSSLRAPKSLPYVLPYVLPWKISSSKD
ncbi:gametocyte-specific factor 1-like [Pelobates fuscus]|uniref:gametocyte-specific factor 1-like n=1 Tax=Pelobates fuscus TaxID=191477 RepID=UPI002FE4C728